MDLYMLISVLSVIHSWILCTVLSAPAGQTPAASAVTEGRHVRTKRCSCATFLDKECVYFCHLDIIWVNTPERVVSYGLGSAPRAKRALADSMATGSGARCRCVREGDDDGACAHFCGLEKRLRYETPPDSAEGDGGAELAADTGRIRRVTSNSEKRVLPLLLRAALKSRLLLEKWRVRRQHRARERQGESEAS